ncbi:folate family ECF transporter S component [Aerococcus urinae]|uniref:folate family ECF transporter S component n=1 Tax=Aerococcus urinae TaxID=1376 RepID=UPI00255107B3|nr:folate family ECF transporter S component [Aerococcus urinae]MDK6651916.1 folate family ECF transporter S component [Aerococcus urinae]
MFRKWLPLDVASSRVITGMGLLMALNLLLNQFRLVLGPTLEISFAFIPLAIMGAFYGPIYAGIGAGLCDVIGFVLSPSGFFFPGFTFNAVLAGLIYGFVLFRQGYNLKRILIAKVLTTVLISLFLTPLWLNMMYQSGLFAWARIIRTAVLFPADLFLLIIIFKMIERSRAVKNMRSQSAH